MAKLTGKERNFLINLLHEDKDVPYDFKEKIFPTEQKEYELAYGGKMREEDLLADEDGTSAYPLQVEKSFNGKEHLSFEDGWQNMIVFGDNLQFLKTIIKDENELIKGKVKGKVKLIYIDPPFATADEFGGQSGAKAYNDKKKGAEFIEFLRKRLILAREVLADDGSIFVHLDQKMSHYIKVVLDEVFGKSNFKNEIIWHYYSGGASENSYAKKHDALLFYTKTKNNIFNHEKEKKYVEGKKEGIEELKHSSREWFKDEGGTYTYVFHRDVWYIPIINPRDTKEKTGYPTQKPEALLEKIIRASTNENDIVMDFFGGSGTTMAVAERLNRKWITCDLGKLSYFTMQKRILQIQGAKILEHQVKPNGEKCKSFVAIRFGTYDWKEALSLEWEKYQQFVAQLFNVKLKPKKVSGHQFEGEKGSYPVKIFDYNKFQNSGIDEDYLKSLHAEIGNKVGSRVYIVAPANSVNYLSDYEEIGKVRYYFLKIPYSMIEELHKEEFRKARQPRSKNNINDLEESIGFHFIRQPKVKSKMTKNDNKIKLLIEEFESSELLSNRAKEEVDLKSFEMISAIFIDKNYNGRNFEMDEVCFADDLKPTESGMMIELKKSELGKKIMIIYTDIYGNDFTEIHTI